MKKILLIAALCLTACNPGADWSGKWTGPEGTYMNITNTDAGMADLAIRNLDGERSFKATRTRDTLTFERDGVTETVRHGNGVDTGMKWLAGKKDCLVVKPGEGYCRD